jgi:5-deoxy-glucuronate isomerase
VQAWLSPTRAVAPGPDGTRWLGFRYLELASGEHRLGDAAAGFEAALVLVQGEVEVARGGDAFRLGPRANPFDDLPWAAYLPAGDEVRVRCAAPSAVALAWAEGGAGRAAYRVEPAEIALETRGIGATERIVRHLLETDRPAARLYLVEVLTPAAHWSSFPPHRHDRHAPPDEYAMEEAYLFRVEAPGHRALMGAWSEGGADAVGRSPDGGPGAFLVGDGDLVLVAAGYHTVSAAPGGRLYYLNAMAGPERVWRPVFHPAYLDLVEGWGNAPIDRPADDGGRR